jgi:peptide/nickel transport system substrate-binding protein
MKTRMIALLCALVMGFAVLSGCSNGNAPTASGNAAQEAPTTAPDTAPDTQAAPAPVSAEDEKYGGTLYFGYPYDLTRPNFILTGDGPGNFVRELTWDTLFVVNEKSELIPRLAEKYELSSDGLTYDVKLRPGVTWHDGTPFTANDIVFFFDYYPRIDSVDLSYDFSNFKAEKVDDLTVKFTLSELDATFAYTTLAEISFIPEHIWKDIDPTIWDEISDLSKLVGIGPFKLVERVESEYLRFERFDEYWDQKPYLESVVLQLIPDATALALAFESKQVQLAQVNYENTFQVLEGAEGFKFYFKPSANLGIFMVNHNDPLLSQLPIRKAVSFLIDRQSLILAQKNGAAALDSAFTPVDLAVFQRYPLRDSNRQGRRMLVYHEFLLRKNSKLKNGKDAVFQHYPLREQTRQGRRVLLCRPLHEQTASRNSPGKICGNAPAITGRQTPPLTRQMRRLN